MPASGMNIAYYWSVKFLDADEYILEQKQPARGSIIFLVIFFSKLYHKKIERVFAGRITTGRLI